MWQYIGGPKLVPEYKFHPSRRWRADFAHVEAKVLIEIEGAVWAKGRHTRGGGFIADAEKYNTATLNGWRVFRLADRMISRMWCERIADFIRTEGRKDDSPRHSKI